MKTILIIFGIVFAFEIGLIIWRCIRIYKQNKYMKELKELRKSWGTNVTPKENEEEK